MPVEAPKFKIKKMPDREVLEAFLLGFHGQVTVVFNEITGEFEEIEKKKKEEDDRPIDFNPS